MRIPWRVWAYGLLLAFVMSVPHLLAVANTPDGWLYSGALPIPEGFRVDYNSHMAKMWQGSRGDFTYELLFTHQEHPGLFLVQGFYVALGVFARGPLGFALVFHLARIIGTLFVVGMLWLFAGRLFKSAQDRWLALFIGTAWMGWGWVLFFLTPDAVQNIAPIEFWLLDAYTFTSLLYMPHFSFAIGLLIASVIVYSAWVERGGWILLALLTAILALDAIIQPYVVLLTFPFFGLLIAYDVFGSKRLALMRALWLLIPASVHGGLVVAQFVAISSHPVWAEFSAQNTTFSPPPLYLFIGYAPFLLFALPGLWGAWKQIDKNPLWLAPILWVLLVVLLVYVPLATQRRYLLAAQIPLALLAALGWREIIVRRLSRRARLWVLLSLSTLSLMAPLLLIFQNTVFLQTPESTRAVYYTADERIVADHIREQAAVDALILSTFDPSQRGTGGAIVSLTGRRVYVGHWIETPDYDAISALLEEQFFHVETDDAFRRDLLTNIGADYLWYDEEAASFGDWSPDDARYLTKVVDTPSVDLYEVIP